MSSLVPFPRLLVASKEDQPLVFGRGRDSHQFSKSHRRARSLNRRLHCASVIHTFSRQFCDLMVLYQNQRVKNRTTKEIMAPRNCVGTYRDGTGTVETSLIDRTCSNAPRGSSVQTVVRAERCSVQWFALVSLDTLKISKPFFPTNTFERQSTIKS